MWNPFANNSSKYIIKKIKDRDSSGGGGGVDLQLTNGKDKDKDKDKDSGGGGSDESSGPSSPSPGPGSGSGGSGFGSSSSTNDGSGGGGVGCNGNGHGHGHGHGHGYGPGSGPQIRPNPIVIVSTIGSSNDLCSESGSGSSSRDVILINGAGNGITNGSNGLSHNKNIILTKSMNNTTSTNIFNFEPPLPPSISMSSSISNPCPVSVPVSGSGSGSGSISSPIIINGNSNGIIHSGGGGGKIQIYNNPHSNLKSALKKSSSSSAPIPPSSDSCSKPTNNQSGNVSNVTSVKIGSDTYVDKDSIAKATSGIVPTTTTTSSNNNKNNTTNNNNNNSNNNNNNNISNGNGGDNNSKIPANNKTSLMRSVGDENDSDEEDDTVPGLSPKGGVMHCRIVNAFTNAFAKQNVHFEKAIQSLDLLNEQIISFVFSPDAEALHKDLDGKNGEAKYSEAFKVSIALMRRLLLDAQGKFRKMVEENKALAGRLDGDLQSAHRQMALLRAELSDTNKRISQLSSPPSTPSSPSHESTHPYNHCNSGSTTANNNCLPQSKINMSPDDSNPSKIGAKDTGPQVNGIQSNSNNNGHTNHGDLEFIDSTSTVDLDSLSSAEIRAECDKLLVQNGSLRKELFELRRKGCDGGQGQMSGDIDLRVQELQTELQHAKEALSALKADRKRLKAEKFELLNQMKQLYATLEDKEKELRDFIRNYEQRMRESEASLQRLAIERDEAERERWNILRHARDEAERGLALATQLNVREAQVQQMQEELHDAKRQLAQYGIYSEPDRSSSTNATSHYSLVSSLTATYATVGDRGSSADSGVRLSSDRDSGGGLPTASNLSDSANEAISLDLCGGDGSGDGDSMSVISTATLPQLFATPRDSPGPLSYSSFSRSVDTSALSRSAEQLLAAEAAECRRKSGRRTGADLTGRASAGAKGAWGSISRVFARNKHRRTLDPTLYDAVSTGQRSSWSPQSSVPASPLTEQESYGDKLRALEEAATLPMELWRAGMVQAWIEVSLGMPQYGSRCADNIKSGKVLLELSDSELESELGIAHPLHRKKLRLAIEEHRNPALVRFPCTVELSHVWVSSEWLPDIGLPQYAENFAGCLVDARLLDHLSKKDLEKYLGVTRKFHLAAIAHGVHLLRIVAYDRQSLAERRRQCENDPLVWTNLHFIQWARSIDLNEYADNLKGSGVHGAFAVLEPSFNGDTLASAMGIPPSKQIIRRHLTAELDALLNPARAKITQQYRVTKSRAMTSSSVNTPPQSQHNQSGVLLTDKQRSDSLGRSSTLTNDTFRRSTDDSRRRTSLRTYSLLVAQKGSLSRALGLKIKQDLLHRRQDEKEKSEEKEREREFLGAVSMLGPPPPLPPGLPGKGKMIGNPSSLAGAGNTNENSGPSFSGIGTGISHPQNIAEQPIPPYDDFTSSILFHVNATSGLNSHFFPTHGFNKPPAPPPPPPPHSRPEPDSASSSSVQSLSSTSNPTSKSKENSNMTTADLVTGQQPSNSGSGESGSGIISDNNKNGEDSREVEDGGASPVVVIVKKVSHVLDKGNIKIPSASTSSGTVPTPKTATATEADPSVNHNSNGNNSSITTSAATSSENKKHSRVKSISDQLEHNILPVHTPV